MKRIYLLPNVITAFSLSCGLFIIFRMSMVPIGEVTPKLLTTMAGIFLLAALADLLDGAVARVMKAESEFGGIFDSLSDAISFGVAPVVVILKSAATSTGEDIPFLTASGAMVFSVCGILRLARYNVLALQSKKSEVFDETFNKNFTGLPIPAAATAAVSMNLLLFSDEFRGFWDISHEIRTIILFVMMILLGYFMISRWKFPSMKSLHIRVASFQAVFFTVIPTLLVFYGLMYQFAFVFFALAWIYILIAGILSLARIVSGRKSKTLEDFEPEPDDLDQE
ncbi:MAG: CDP-alcohol phosphatidyltransferase family protein [Parachlamydiaceae bacterium]|nr:CDP-alcohol phosphatidyltransferase family protein [Parachlamydiaceae bacterium]